MLMTDTSVNVVDKHLFVKQNMFSSIFDRLSRNHTIRVEMSSGVNLYGSLVIQLPEAFKISAVNCFIK